MTFHNNLKVFVTVISTFIFFTCLVPSFGQQGSLLFHHLKLEDGLSEQTNVYVYKDSKGFVWISSINGLNRFDGTKVKRYNPDLNDSTSIFRENVQSNFFEDDSTRLWFSTYDAINCYQRKSDNFKHYFLRDKDNEPIQGYNVFHLDPTGDLWVLVNEESLYTFNIHTHRFQFITKLKHTSNRAVAFLDPGGYIKTIITAKADVRGIEHIEFDHNSCIVRDSVIGNEEKTNLIHPRAMVLDGDSVLWLCGNDTLTRYQWATRSFTQRNIPQILTIQDFNDSTLLVSIDDQGIWEYNKHTSDFIYQYTSSKDNPLSLLTNTIEYISRDRDRGFWMCSTGYGLSYTYPEKKKFNLYNPVSLVDAENSNFNPVTFIENSPDEIICPTYNGGVFVVDKQCRLLGKIGDSDIAVNPGIVNIFYAFADKRKNIWLNTFKGLSLLNTQSKTIELLTNSSLVVLSGTEALDGKLYFAVRDSGIYEGIFENNKYNIHRFAPEILDKDYLPVWRDSRGIIWGNEELQKFVLVDPSTKRKIAEIPISGICNQFIEDQDQQTIWIATSTGLYNVDSREYVICNLYNAKNGLHSVGINSMLMDKAGNLWLASKNGIFVFNPAGENRTLYSIEDGLPYSEFVPGAAHQFGDGEMWFASMSGITKFYPDQLKKISVEAIPQITSLDVNDHPSTVKLICERTNATNITEIKELTFTPKQNTLTFTINALEFSSPKNNKVKYRLEPSDKEWVETSSGSPIRYPDLRHGKYTFNVMAANSDGVYSSQIRQMIFEIPPPFYLTWWFMVLASLATLGLVVYIVYLNFSKTIELQKVRLRLYENLHDDVGSRLTAIVLSAEELVQQEKEVHPKLQHIAKVSKSIVGNMRRLVWAIDPENDSMNSLVQKIRYDKSLILDDKTEFHIDLEHQLKHMIVPGEIRYQVTSIISEALNNISKYAHAQNVWIQFTKKDGLLHLVIRDDGVGFNKEETGNDKVKSTGYGMGTMQKRVARVKGSFEINSKPGEGTVIEVKIPMK